MPIFFFKLVLSTPMVMQLFQSMFLFLRALPITENNVFSFKCIFSKTKFLSLFCSIHSPVLLYTKNVYVKDLFSKCDRIRGKLRIFSHLLKKSSSHIEIPYIPVPNLYKKIFWSDCVFWATSTVMFSPSVNYIKVIELVTYTFLYWFWYYTQMLIYCRIPFSMNMFSQQLKRVRYKSIQMFFWLHIIHNY